MKKKILILGATGMLGSAVYKYFSEKEEFIVFGSSREKHNKFYFFEAGKNNSLKKLLNSTKKIDFVINCIGILKHDSSIDSSINYSLPKKINDLQKVYDFRLIHVSTDDVFDPNSNRVNENSKPSPVGKYGKSKQKGEIDSPNIINVRTSIIGFDSRDRKGLIEWIIKNNNKAINGFINQKWSGCTMLQFAKLCDFLVEDDNFDKQRANSPFLHFAPLGPISKYSLIKKISRNLNLNIKIKKNNSKEEITRELYSIYLTKNFLKQFNTDIDLALKKLIRFENK